MEKQKWINNNGILYPKLCPLLPAPWNGVFRIYKKVQTKRFGMKEIDETFNFKIYGPNCELIMQRIIKRFHSLLYIARIL